MEEPAKKSGGKKVLGIVGAIVVALVIAGLKFGVGSAIGGFFNKDETADAKAGDCIAELPEVTGSEQEEVDGAKVVECTSTDAAYTVVVSGRRPDRGAGPHRCGLRPVLQGGPGGLRLLRHRAGQDGLPALPDQEGLTGPTGGTDGGAAHHRAAVAVPGPPTSEREVNATSPASSRHGRGVAGYRHVGPLGDQPTMTDR
ncbi:hypothetical protein [Micromonospora sp. WMMC415]|uniref:hypothetical protein n=1 Tax=Micromonospora sp. WMMC415 TaxID=2675222 RepID=UPI001E359CD2|nr:hypothetical protein [Micromonospora sp. WMMC415]